MGKMFESSTSATTVGDGMSSRWRRNRVDVRHGARIQARRSASMFKIQPGADKVVLSE